MLAPMAVKGTGLVGEETELVIHAETKLSPETEMKKQLFQSVHMYINICLHVHNYIDGYRVLEKDFLLIELSKCQPTCSLKYYTF